MSLFAFPRHFWSVAIVALTLCIWCVPADAQQKTEVDDLPVVERHRYGTIYQLPDGKRRALLTVHAQNFQRPDGSWAAIREELDPVTSTPGAFECLENGLVSRFGVNADGAPVMTAYAQGRAPITMTASGLVARDAAGAELERLAPWVTSAAQTRFNRVEFAGVYTGATDEYIVAAERVKHTLYLDSPALQAVGNAAWIGGATQIALPDGHVLTQPDGTPISGTVTTDGWLAISVNGKPAYRLHPVIVTDADGSEGPGRYTVAINADGTVELVMETDAVWAGDPARALPIAIDPTLTIQPDPGAGKDTVIMDNNPNSNFGTFNSIGGNFGATILYALIQFDVTPIPAAATVDSTSLEMYHWGNGASNDSMTFHLVTEAWVENTVTYNNQPAINDANADLQVYPSGMNVWRNFTGMTSTVQGWVDGGITNNGLLLRNDTRTAFVLYHHSSDYVDVPADRARLVVDYTDAPVLPTIDTPVAGALNPGEVNEAFSVTFTGIGGQTPYTWSIDSLPPGLTLNASTGELSGTPSTAGNYSFDITLTDANNDTDLESYTLEIFEQLLITAPAAGALADGSRGQPYGPVNFTATGGSTPYAWSVSAGSLPAGLTLNASTGVLSGTPTALGNSSFDVTVTDANSFTDTRSYTIAVVDVVTITGPAAGALVEGYLTDGYSVTVTAAGGTPGYTWTVSAGALPNGLSINGSTGEISGTPTAAGNFSFTIQVEDTVNDTDTRAFTIDVVTLPSVSSPSPGALSEGTANAPTAYGLPAVDFESADGVTPHAWSATGLPAGLTINASTGVISGTPTTAGTSNVTVTVTDANGKQANGAYTITINDAISVATSSLPDASETATYSTTVTASGGTTSFTWAAVFTPTVADFAINTSTGEITGNPDFGDAGTYDVQITVTDQYGSTDTVTLTLTITQPSGSIGSGGGGCSCTADPTPTQSRDQHLQVIAFILLIVTLALIRRRLG